MSQDTAIRAFRDKYAACYDVLYHDKDYSAECDFVEEILRRYSRRAVSSILDLGCGTGGHVLPLVKRGYAVTGIDLSEEMIMRAREKAGTLGQHPDLLVMDMRELCLDRGFDAVLAMFSALGYVTETRQLLQTIFRVKSHLQPGGVFTLDCWNGLAVLRMLPSTRCKVVSKDGLTVIRIAEPELDAFHHVCNVHYRVLCLEGERLAADFQEVHRVRFLFPQEVTAFLEGVGFEVLEICPFMELGGKVDERVWNMSVVARLPGGEL